MDWFIASAYAQAEAPAGGSGSMFFFMILMLVVFWFILIRPQMKQQKQHRELVQNLDRGDEVLTGGGLMGRIDDLSEGLVVLEVAPNVKVKVQRHSIVAVLPKGTLKAAG